MRIWLFLVLLATISTAAQAAPQQVSASYRVIKSGQVVGKVTEHFEQTGQHYRIEHTTTATGIFALFARGAIRLISEGDITQNGLRPLHFEHHRGADPAKLIVAEFDWSKLSIAHKYDGKSETAPLTPGAQDRLSQLYQFMFQPPLPPHIEFHVSTGRRLNLYRYQLIGEETITTPAGTFQTLHLSKQRTPDDDGTELWLAKSRHYFPVRIVFLERNGGNLEQQLEHLTFTPDAPPPQTKQ